MKRITLMLLVLAVATVALANYVGTYYSLSGVWRVDRDLYRSDSNLFVQTWACHHECEGENAVLHWNGNGGYDNKILWQDETECRVYKVFMGR